MHLLTDEQKLKAFGKIPSTPVVVVVLIVLALISANVLMNVSLGPKVATINQCDIHTYTNSLTSPPFKVQDCLTNMGYLVQKYGFPFTEKTTYKNITTKQLNVLSCRSGTPYRENYANEKCPTWANFFLHGSGRSDVFMWLNLWFYLVFWTVTYFIFKKYLSSPIK